MPRRTKPEAVIPTTSMVASAVNYKSRTSARVYIGARDWQSECYRHYSICGEARFAAQFYGHAMSKALLTTYKKGPDGPILQTEGSGYDYLQALFNGKDGQAQMLHAAGVHLTIAGEFYLVGRLVAATDLDPETGEEYETGDTHEIWEIVSIQEIKATGPKWKISYGNGTRDIDLTDDDVVIRIWDPSPENRMQADSPFRALLPILAEIEWLTRSIFAQTSSRLAGAGLLLLPQDMTFPKPPALDGQEVENDTDAFMRVLADAMLAPIEDPSSPSAMVPITIQAPGESIDKARLMHFWSDLDAASGSMRQEAVRRFATGMDLPPEQIMGMHSGGGTGGGASAGVSHWGAWQIDETTIKMHIEPKLELVANALSIGYLRPLNGPDEFVGFDSSALRLRPDRSKEALELYNLGLLSAEVTLRENGFALEDAPDPDEFKQWLLRRVASGSATPDQVGAALEALGVVLNTPDLTAPPPPDTEMPNEARPAPSLEDHPTRDLPEGLLAASEALVFRALERSGNRIRQMSGIKPSGVKAFDIHTLHHVNGEASKCLEDAWSCAPQVLDGIAPVEKTVATLDAYVRSLFATQQPHSREALRKWLAAAR